MKKVNAIIEQANDGTYSIYMDAPEMNYLVTGTGHTAEEAMKTFIGGYEDMKALYAKQGKPFEEVDFTFKYDMASFLSYYSKAFSLAGLSRITGVNQGQLSHYMNRRRNPSRTTIQKIQDSVHSFAADLIKVRFV